MRRKVEALNAALGHVAPGYGFQILNQLENTFQTAVAGRGFLWGAETAMRWGQLDANLFEEPNYPPGEYSLRHFSQSVPDAAFGTAFRLDQAWRAARACKSGDAPAGFLWITSLVERLFDACWHANNHHFYTLGHLRFLSWRDAPVQAWPAVYLAWDGEDCVMHRLVDDFYELVRATGALTDLTWCHGFQLGHRGAVCRLAQRQVASKERRMATALRRDPETVAWHMPEYEARPLLDGSLAHAVTALRLVLGIVKILDEILYWLDEGTPADYEGGATLAELARRGTL